MNKAHGRAVERLPTEWAARVAVGQDLVDALKAEHVRAPEHRGGIVNIKTDGAMVLRNALLCQLPLLPERSLQRGGLLAARVELFLQRVLGLHMDGQTDGPTVA